MECWACGRTDVKKRPRAGKQFYPHRCPHGVPCTAGSRMGKEGMNGPARGGPCYCAACVARANERKE
jgi:hypothetical protein